MSRARQFSGESSPPDPRAMSLLTTGDRAHFRSTPSDSNPDTATAQTVAVMCRHIKEAAKDPLVSAAAGDAVRRFRGGPFFAGNSEPERQACSDWWWAKHAVRFVHHDELIRAWLSESDQLQLLIPPEALLRMKEPQGDCAIFTMLVCAMLRAQGIGYEIVTVAATPQEPDIFSHVYARAILPEGRMPLDASHGAYPGWEVPRAHITKMQVWDEDGNPVADRASRFNGLHAYRSRGLRGFRRGLGEPSFEEIMASTPVSEGGTCTTCDSGPDIYMGGGSSYPSGGGGSSWTPFLQGLVTQWSQIGGRVIAPTTTVQRGPNGQLMISTPANSAAASSALLNAGGGIGGSSLLMIGGIAIAGLLVFKAFSK